MSNANPPAPTVRLRGAYLGFGLLVLVLYGVFIGRNFANVAGGADSSGYFNSARLLAAGKFTTEMRTPPEFGPQSELRHQLFHPHGFLPFGSRPGLAPTYAPGLPLHFALASKLVGWSWAAPAVGIAAALAALILMYATARELGLEIALAASSVVILGAYPVFLFTSFQPLSDTLATTWCLAAVYAALRARHHRAWAVAGGLAVAVAVLVRATNLLLLPALVILLGWDWRRLGLATLGGLPGAAWLGYYNHSLYGSALSSGYVNLGEAFDWSHGPPTVLHFTLWLGGMLPAILFPLAGLSLFRAEGRGRLVLAMAAWFLPFATFYAFYEISREVWWDLRFILPATPAFILAGMLGLQIWLERRPFVPAARIRPILAGALAAWTIGLGWFWSHKFHLQLIPTYEQAYADSAAAAHAQFPGNALVVAGLHSGALYYYTPFAVLRWEAVQPGEFARFASLARQAQRPICAVLFDVEESTALQEKCPGDWQRIGNVRNTSLWQLSAAPVAARE